MSSLSFLVSSRKCMRTSITKTFNNLEGIQNSPELEKQSVISRMLELRDTILEANSKIMQHRWEADKNEEDLQAEYEACEAYNDRIRIIIATLSVPVVQASNQTQDMARSLLKSPTAPLPRFYSKTGENLELFLSNFEETLSKFNYTEYDKLLLLKQQVEGKGSYLLDSLEPNRQTFGEAKNLLMNAFASVDVQKFNLIKQLSEMKLGIDDEPFEYMSNMRKIQQSVKQLNLSLEDVLQYFFYNGMNESFKSQMVLITNKVRPTLDEINDNFFEANERYCANQRIKENKVIAERNVAAHAISVKTEPPKNPFYDCTLCRGSSRSIHGINRCTAFLTPLEKILRLKDLGGCGKCANLDHTTEKCKFRFKKQCTLCSRWHFSFLCTNTETPQKESLSSREKLKQKFGDYESKNFASKERKSQNKVATVTTVFKGFSNLESVLPTFTCSFINGRKIRGLRDSGSQSNLVSERALAGQMYEILDNDVNLTVNGINESKTYKSKLVEINLIFGDKVKKLNAMTLPDINISLELPGLSTVVDGFLDKGYSMADDNLKHQNFINGIDFILGADAAHCFEDNSISFGPDHMSVFLESHMGVMLVGNIPQLLNDLKYLPLYNKVSTNESFVCNVSTIGNFDNLVLDDFESKDLISNERAQSGSLDRAVESCLEDHCNHFLNKEDNILDTLNSDADIKLVDYLLSNTTRKEDGRLVMPLLWNCKVNHLLANNYNLAVKVLESSKKKLTKTSNLALMNDAVKELEQIGAIERINNLSQYMEENPSCSFLAHMPVIKPDRETTKCRIVLLSNLCDRNKTGISHNQAMLTGPCLNQKLSTALLMLRFDEKLLTFDLKKAFLQIELPESDQSKLLFLWYKNVKEGDFSIQAYKSVRLSFGLRCSPTILMVALYKILVIDCKDDSQELKDLKSLIYSLIYMDNGAISAQTSEKLNWAYSKLQSIFSPYMFDLQQMRTNDEILSAKLPDPDSSQKSGLFGLVWDRKLDTISTKKKILNVYANSKRTILKSIAENFDPYNFDGPVLNRARIFMHKLQQRKDLGWDDVLYKEELNEWMNISKQVNSARSIVINRFVGCRNDSYNLIAFCDSSKLIYGTTIYIQNKRTNHVHFLLSKNRMVSSNLESKSIPSLELLSIVLGTETIAQLKLELSGPSCLNPVKISECQVFSDSLVALSWINSYFVKLDKMNKQSVFIMNRLERLRKLTDICPCEFSFVDGIENPADYITRPVSHKILLKTNYLAGPKFLTNLHPEGSKRNIMNIKVPFDRNLTSVYSGQVTTEETFSDVYLSNPNKFSKFSSLVKTFALVYQFCEKIKGKIKSVSPHKESLGVNDRALMFVLKEEQRRNFPEIFKYFAIKNPNISDMPNLVRQLNVFVDNNNILRVGSKMVKHNKFQTEAHCPILLCKSSYLTQLIVREIHEKLNHGGVYSVLTELRKQYWVPHCYSFVKKVLRKCVRCKRFGQRTLKLNQSPYPSFRLNPTNIPFSEVFIDHLGPFYVKGVEKTKVWLLCITCLWSRAVNLKIAEDLTTEAFLRNLQMHSFEYGVPLKVFSDLGSQIVAGANTISSFLNDPEVSSYFKEHGFLTTKFQQYYKGCHKLGSLVESCVKQTKKLLFGAIGRNVLTVRDFEFLVGQTINLINKRPVAFKEALRGDVGDCVPEAITPELLIHGFHMISLNLIPSLQSVPDDPDWQAGDDPVLKLRSVCSNLRKVRVRLIELYNTEFLAKLIYQATNDKDRYQPVTHKGLEVGDIVLIKEEHSKPSQYPMALVRSLTINDLGEVTGAELLKGSTGEILKRHASCIVPLLSESNQGRVRGQDHAKLNKSEFDNRILPRPKRQAAVQSTELTRQMLSD